MGFIYLLRIELYHRPEPKPWVAQITGRDPRFTWQRTFLQPNYDWSKAKKMSNGGVRGLVAQYVLREGNVYEVSQWQGRGKRRSEERGFFLVRNQQLVPVIEEDGVLWV